MPGKPKSGGTTRAERNNGGGFSIENRDGARVVEPVGGAETAP